VGEKQYKTEVGFNSICPTTSGAFCLGSLDGSLRLYKQVGQNAKTLLPGLGEEIRSIDISLDEEWLLATCHSYLLIVPVKKESGESGFLKSLGNPKPDPKKLTVKIQDRNKYQISFD